MNNARRKQIEAIKGRLGAVMAEADNIREELEAIRDEEQDYLDNMPDSFADGEKGQKADAAIDALMQVIEDLEDLTDNEFETALDTAME